MSTFTPIAREGEIIRFSRFQYRTDGYSKVPVLGCLSIPAQ
jgi:hypothetical protein